MKIGTFLIVIGLSLFGAIGHAQAEKIYIISLSDLAEGGRSVDAVCARNVCAASLVVKIGGADSRMNFSMEVVDGHV